MKRTTALRRLATTHGAIDFEINFSSVSVFFADHVAAGDFTRAARNYDRTISARSRDVGDRVEIELSLG